MDMFYDRQWALSFPSPSTKGTFKLMIYKHEEIIDKDMLGVCLGQFGNIKNEKSRVRILVGEICIGVCVYAKT